MTAKQPIIFHIWWLGLSLGLLYLIFSPAVNNDPAQPRLLALHPSVTPTGWALTGELSSLQLQSSTPLTVNGTATATRLQATPPTTPTATPTAQVTHQVSLGETLLQIATDYEITVAELAERNQISTESILQLSQQLIIPVTPGSTEQVRPSSVASEEPPEPIQPTPTPIFYTVQSGDTPAAIALQFGTTADAVMRVNSIRNASGLRVGDVLIIPNIATTDGETWHTVGAGDTPGLLADQYGVTIEAILTANPGLAPTNLQVGQQILIPIENE